MIDIREETRGICEKLGFPPEAVAMLSWRPLTLTATVYKLDESGRKHVDPATGEAAVETVTTKVFT